MFESEDRRDAFIDNVRRSGIDIDIDIDIEPILGEDAKPWQVIVGDAFPKNQLPAGR